MADGLGVPGHDMQDSFDMDNMDMDDMFDDDMLGDIPAKDSDEERPNGGQGTEIEMEEVGPGMGGFLDDLDMGDMSDPDSQGNPTQADKLGQIRIDDIDLMGNEDEKLDDAYDSGMDGSDKASEADPEEHPFDLAVGLHSSIPITWSPHF